jgi:hypothetical protein
VHIGFTALFVNCTEQRLSGSPKKLGPAALSFHENFILPSARTRPNILLPKTLEAVPLIRSAPVDGRNGLFQLGLQLSWWWDVELPKICRWLKKKKA